MIKRRIVKEIYKDGTLQYRVEKYTKFSGWHIEMRVVHVEYLIDTLEPLRFNTLEEAKKYCGVPTNPIISEEIIKI